MHLEILLEPFSLFYKIMSTLFWMTFSDMWTMLYPCCCRTSFCASPAKDKHGPFEVASYNDTRNLSKASGSKKSPWLTKTRNSELESDLQNSLFHMPTPYNAVQKRCTVTWSSEVKKIQHNELQRLTKAKGDVHIEAIQHQQDSRKSGHKKGATAFSNVGRANADSLSQQLCCH